ncbi:MAG: hypothetical protein V1838_05385 [Patescibacteria group bacterium]
MSENSTATVELPAAELENRPDREPDRIANDAELYGERFSIAAAFAHTMAEIDENGAYPPEMYEDTAAQPEIKSDKEAFRQVLKEMVKYLNQNDHVKRARLLIKKEGPGELDKYERKHLLKAYERAREHAFKKVNMSEDQLDRLKFETRSEFNRGLGTAILTKAEPESWMVVYSTTKNMRLINWMSSQKIVQCMKNALTTKSSDIIKAEIKTIREEANNDNDVKEAHEELMKTPEYNKVLIEEEK